MTIAVMIVLGLVVAHVVGFIVMMVAIFRKDH